DLRSQQTWAHANENGYFDAELAPVEVQTRKGVKKIEVDEHPRPDTTPETLAKLAPVFKKDGVVTAGNASGICDGAGAVVIASADKARELGRSPIARLVSFGVVGVEPSIMGIGPVEASRQALQRASLTLDDMDLVEVNEAF